MEHSSRGKYVVAFNRARDFYQVPLALCEIELLSSLVTDCYYPNDQPLLRRLPGVSSLKHRYASGLPSSLVHWTMKALLPQVASRLTHSDRHMSFSVIDRALSVAALNYAEREEAHLFLYSHYAYQAFTSKRSGGMVKGLFMFHPHTDLVREILQQDFAAHPECRRSYEVEADIAGDEGRLAEVRDEWRYANFIVCASEFTARSLRHVGCRSKLITIAPYGVDTTKVPFIRSAERAEHCRFLFVGQGVQRKGLHQLLKAWRSARLHNAELTIIATNMDPGIAELAGPTIRILPRQSYAELMRHYSEHHVFVMPSLVEGFGFVYLEALSAGCYCIGTRNTGLPDIANFLPKKLDAISVIEAGNIDELTAALNNACSMHQRRDIDHRRIQESAKTISWDRFRASIAKIASDNLPD
jgi:glycosyltransferase involved in cell wall biosynthesis